MQDLQEINRALKRPRDLQASPQTASPSAKIMRLGGGGGPVQSRRPPSNSFLQALTSVANFRAKSAAANSELNQQ